MSLKTVAIRASAEPSPAERAVNPVGLVMGMITPCPIGFRLAPGGGLLNGFTEDERRAIEARFWPKVNKTDGCWLWTASVTGKGTVNHGQFTLPRQADGTQPHVYAHRVSWTLAYGPIPDGLNVCHHCDVPRCVRPEHLFLGTQYDNLADARRKGRLDNTLSRTRKLTLADRLAIYYMPNRRGVVVELALHYGVTKTCISLTRSGRFTGAPIFERVPYRQVPIRGEVAS